MAIQQAVTSPDEVDLLRRRQAELENELSRLRAQKEVPGGESRLLRAMLDELPAIVWTTDTQLTFTSSAGSGLKELKLVANEVVGRTIFEFLGTADESYPPIAAHLLALQGEHATIENDWGGRWYETHLRPLRDEHEEIIGCLGISHDITKRNAIEKQLRKSEDLLCAAVKNAQLVAFNYDRDLRITWIYNHDRDLNLHDLLGKTDADLLPPDSAAYLMSIKRNVLESGIGTRQEVYVTDHRGEDRHFDLTVEPLHDDHGQICGVACTSLDITERKRLAEKLLSFNSELKEAVTQRTAELTSANTELQRKIDECEHIAATLKESEESHRLLAEHSTDIITRNLTDGRIYYISPACYPLLGFRPHELTGMSPYDFIHPEDVASVVNMHTGLLIGNDSATVTYRTRRKDGIYTWLESLCKAIRDTNGNVLEMVCVSRDVTARVEAEQRARELGNELAHASRISTLGQMATGLAHELTQPLSSIVGYAEGTIRNLTGELRKPQDLVKPLREIVDEAQRASQIIKHMRDFLKKQMVPMTSVAINSLVEDVLAFLHSELRSNGVEVRRQLGANLPELQAHAVQIEQVIVNLIYNSIDAMRGKLHGESRITITTSLNADGAVQTTVADSGAGMTEEAFQSLFKPFFTTKTNGLGVGLSISKSIVEAHGGRFWATRKTERGMTFNFSLPVNVREV